MVVKCHDNLHTAQPLTYTEAERPTELSELPVDVLGFLLKHLEPFDLSRVACVSRAWRVQVLEEDAVWKAACEVTFGKQR